MPTKEGRARVACRRPGHEATPSRPPPGPRRLRSTPRAVSGRPSRPFSRRSEPSMPPDSSGDPSPPCRRIIRVAGAVACRASPPRLGHRPEAGRDSDKWATRTSWAARTNGRLGYAGPRAPPVAPSRARLTASAPAAPGWARTVMPLMLHRLRGRTAATRGGRGRARGQRGSNEEMKTIKILED